MPATVANRNSMLNAWLRAAAYTGTASLFLSLHTADPGDAGASELTGGSYARVGVTFAAAVAASSGLVAQTDFAGMPAATITHVGLWSAATLGTFHGGGALSASKVTGVGDTLRFVATTGVVGSIS